MPVTVKLISQDGDDSQVLRTDNRKKFIVNHADEWQFLFGPNSALSNSQHVVKISAEFDTSDFDSIRFVAYLYNPVTGGVDNAATCQFAIYKATQPQWFDVPVVSFAGTQIANSYFFADTPLSSMSSVDFDGGDTIMVDVAITRLSETYRDRIYINHLGIYDNVFRLRQDVEYIDLTKVDE